LAESLLFFDRVVNSGWHRRTSIILILTGIYEFIAKIHDVRHRKFHSYSPDPTFPFTNASSFLQVPLDEYFPGYAGGTNADEGIEYIREQFEMRNRDGLPIFIL